MPLGRPSSSCWTAIVPRRSLSMTIAIGCAPSRTAVSSSFMVMAKPPSPQMATAMRSGSKSDEAIAAGRPKPIVPGRRTQECPRTTEAKGTSHEGREIAGIGRDHGIVRQDALAARRGDVQGGRLGRPSSPAPARSRLDRLPGRQHCEPRDDCASHRRALPHAGRTRPHRGSGRRRPRPQASVPTARHAPRAVLRLRGSSAFQGAGMV